MTVAMFWAIAVILAGLLVAALALPALRPGADGDAAARAETAARLKMRLAEIAAARAAGLVDADAAAEAEVEAKRAALAETTDAPRAAPARTARLAAVGAAGLVPIAAAAFYFVVGSPPGKHVAGAAAPVDPAATLAGLPPEERAAAIRAMVDGLDQRLDENPDDIEGWRMLARARGVLGDDAAAARAWGELLKRVEGGPEDWRAYAGALMAAGPGDGRAPELAQAMARLEALSPDDPLALYYLGAEAKAAGDAEKARAYLRRLLNVLPADAPVRPAIEGMLSDLGEEEP